MTGQQLSDPVIGAPTSRSPWFATLVWTPEQNGGRVGTSEARIPLAVLWGRLRSGETVDELARDFGLQVSAVHVVDRLRREVEDARNDDVTRCGVQVHLQGLGTFPCVVVEDQDGGHDGDCVTAPERDGTWPPARAVVERAIAWREQWKSGSGNAAAVQLADAVERMQANRPGAALVRAEHVSGVRVEAGPSSPLMSPAGRDDERGLRAKVSSLHTEPTLGDLGIADGPGGEYRSGPAAIVNAELRVADEPHYAVIEVRGPEGVEYPVVERNTNGPAGWRSGAYVYLDADVVSVRPLVAHLADDPDVVVLDRSDWDDIKVIGERWPKVRAELEHLRTLTAPADLPATLASVDDVRRVCEVAGLSQCDGGWRGDEPGDDVYVITRKTAPGAAIVQGVATVLTGAPGSLLYAAIQAARSAS